MIVLNPFLDSLCNFGLKNIGLTPGTGSGCFQSSQDIVIMLPKDVSLFEQIVLLISKFLQIHGLQPRISKIFFRSLKQFFLTVRQNSFCNKIPMHHFLFPLKLNLFWGQKPILYEEMKLAGFPCLVADYRLP